MYVLHNAFRQMALTLSLDKFFGVGFFVVGAFVCVCFVALILFFF